MPARMTRPQGSADSAEIRCEGRGMLKPQTHSEPDINHGEAVPLLDEVPGCDALTFERWRMLTRSLALTFAIWMNATTLMRAWAASAALIWGRVSDTAWRLAPGLPGNSERHS